MSAAWFPSDLVCSTPAFSGSVLSKSEELTMRSNVTCFGTTSLLASMLLLVGTGCGASLAQPFDQLKKSNAQVYVYRLQNFEPPAQQPSASPVPSLIPPQIMDLAKFLPPNLLPPGLFPQAPGAAPATQQTARFHNFRILGWMALADEKTKEEVYDIFGKEKNFEIPKSQCMYAEFGFSFQSPGMQQQDILVSLSCNQAQGFNFAWPHAAKTGLGSDTSKRIIAVAQKSFGG
jgi:hypothetical protein